MKSLSAMRLPSFAVRVGLMLLAALLVTALAPVQAAHAADVAPTLPYAGPGPLSVVAGLFGLAGFGVVMRLKASDPETGKEKRFSLDTEKQDEFYDGLEDYVALQREAASAPLEANLSAAREENDALRGILVGEIVRLKKLTSEKNEDGEPALDVEKETAYLAGLPAERLQMEYERLPKRETVKLSATTTDAGQEGADPYADLKE